MYRFVMVVSFFLMLMSVDTAGASRVVDTDEQFKKIHLSLGYGVSFSSTTEDIINAFYASGFSGSGGFFTAVQFPYDRSKNWSRNIEASFRWVKRWQAGFGLCSVPEEEIVGYGGGNLVERSELEYASGTIYYLTIDYILKTVDKQLWSKWELSAGLGLIYSSLSVGGDLGSYYQAPNIIESEPWELSESKIGGVIRTNLDYYFIRSMSVQLRMSGYIIPFINVPRQSFDFKVLEPHSIDFSAYEMTLRLAIHL